jgi:CheY-like chemotaxis protein
MDEANCYKSFLALPGSGVIPDEGGITMKSALLLDYDDASRDRTAALLKTLGYVVAFAATPQMALRTAGALRFDAILSCTDVNDKDRRSLVGELARLSPGSHIVLLLDEDAVGCGCHDGAGALLVKPATVRGLRRVLEFGIDGMGTPAATPAPACERRRAQRRRQAR